MYKRITEVEIPLPSTSQPGSVWAEYHTLCHQQLERWFISATCKNAPKLVQIAVQVAIGDHKRMALVHRRAQLVSGPVPDSSVYTEVGLATNQATGPTINPLSCQASELYVSRLCSSQRFLRSTSSPAQARSL
jgi:hypothetical protein